jgi:hypothetical protein
LENTLYHPEFKETTEVPNEDSASVLEKSGWTKDVPKKVAAQAQSDEASTEVKEK